MTITERTLKKWRKEALEAVNLFDRQAMKTHEGRVTGYAPLALEKADRILRMTQVLLDQHLINRRP